MTHRDLSEVSRDIVTANATWVASLTSSECQSLALAREAWVAAFDAAAEELYAIEQRAQAHRDYYELRTGGDNATD